MSLRIWEGTKVDQDSSQTSFVAPESKMPDLPGAEDEPYDRRFAKWMIKNMVGPADVVVRGPVLSVVRGRQPNRSHDS